MFDIDFNKYRIVDLSYEVVPGASQERPFEIERSYLRDDTYKHEVRTHSHVGTHVEFPAHFFEGGKGVTDFLLTAFMGRAILLDVEDAEANREIGPEYLEQAIGDLIREGDIVICRNLDRASKEKGDRDALPRLTPGAARWLAEHKIKLLGIDNYFRLSKDVPSGRELHEILMGQDINIIEWLDNLEALRKREFFFMALPYKVRVMDSSWARAIAIEEI